MFYESAQYPFVQPLQTAWQTLRDELQALSTSYFVCRLLTWVMDHTR